MAVLGPGQLLGYMSALEKGVHGSDAVVREDALLLEIPAKEFEKLYFGTSPASTKLHRVIQKSLLLSLGQTNRHLTRLISQATPARRREGRQRAGEGLRRADYRCCRSRQLAASYQVVRSPDSALPAASCARVTYARKGSGRHDPLQTGALQSPPVFTPNSR